MTSECVASSFRDPSGSLFRFGDSLYRRINESYQSQYDLLLASGLYKDLSDAGLLVSHEEVELDDPSAAGAYKILKPRLIPFISYPYEWCFSQLKDAALTTIDIQKRALAHGMTLKDCSAYNIQFADGRPVLIDTLSFEEYREGQPWVAYRQFCQHFLAPLALMSLKDVRFNQLFRVYIDGVPLDLASSILPYRTHFSFGMLLHIHLHAKSQARYADTIVEKQKLAPKVSRQAMLGLIDSLESAVNRLKWKPRGTEWVDYLKDDSYTPAGLEYKQRIVGQYLDTAAPKTVWDFGANTGMYSRLAGQKNATVISFDIDPACVELNYLETTKNGERNVLPLLLDLTNPSPNIGWANEERVAITNRGAADLVMALALVHHLAISNNVPLGRIADYFKGMCDWLVIEFVPKSDPKVKKLLATREDVFPNYTQKSFEQEFAEVFTIRNSQRINESERTLYLMARR